MKTISTKLINKFLAKKKVKIIVGVALSSTAGM